jgi:DNA-binding FrmR family transcriptional regulator
LARDGQERCCREPYPFDVWLLTTNDAVAEMDEAPRDELGARLKRIAGQVTGLQRTIEEGRHYLDVVPQVSGVRAALAKVARLVLAAHVRDSVTEALTAGDRDIRKRLDEPVRVFDHCQI